MGSKDDLPSGSSSQMAPLPPTGSGPPTPTGAQSLQSMQQASKNLKSSMLSQSPQQKPSNLSSKESSSDRDRKSSQGGMTSDEKEMPKVKQEGQKPTMETQGPPPPPTSQFYLHPSFASRFLVYVYKLDRTSLMISF